MFHVIRVLLLSFFILIYSLNAFAKDLKIITTIKPIQSLITNIIDKNDKVDVMIDGNYSPHNFALKPSQIRKIYTSDAVILIDSDFETFMQSGFKIIPDTCKIIKLSDISDIDFLNLTSNDVHDDDNSKINIPDYHIWLSPLNAIKIVNYLTDELSKLNPDKQEIYNRNRATTIEKLLNLDAQLNHDLTSIKNHSFMVFHNAYQYFTKNYQLKYAGAITQNPNSFSSINKIKQAQKILNNNQVKCVFKEPQFSNTLIETIVQGNNVKIAILDPLGGNIPVGHAHYFELMTQIKDNLLKCLGSN
jgi:zinc transport system substrate-binding protein